MTRKSLPSTPPQPAVSGEVRDDYDTQSFDEYTRTQKLIADQSAALADALEPFADIDGEGDEDFPDDEPCTLSFGRTSCFTLTLGDFRRARAAIDRIDGVGK